ncbi:MAG TPA: class IV adenylate cyclase [Thermoplasmata archaeon]|nr:class IV adenylate cyclase [Thermoplasmata archaeon]
MARNVEIKANSRQWDVQIGTARRLATAEHVLLQEDIFFRVRGARLKLRTLGPQSGELILYNRDDKSGPKTSEYAVSPVPDPDSMRRILAKVFRPDGEVKKRRTLFHIGQTRIHFDEVAGLGRFIELEVVLRDDQTEAEGAKIAENLMAQLDIRKEDLIRGAYRDMLKGRRPRPRKPRASRSSRGRVSRRARGSRR